MTRRFWFFVLSAAILSTPALAGDLRVTVKEVRSGVGRIMVALHAAKDGVEFPDQTGAVAAQWADAKGGAQEFVFTGLAPGRYAVAIYHDENGNGVMDKNFVGIPSEGYGFSRNARGFTGPPSFSGAAVDIAADKSRVTTEATLGY